MKKIVISDTDYEKVMRYLKYASEAMVEEKYYNIAGSIKDVAKSIKSCTKKSVRVTGVIGEGVFSVSRINTKDFECNPGIEALDSFRVASKLSLKRGDVVGWTKL